jgi:hypothetical protein
MKHLVVTAFALALSLPVCAQQRLAGKVVDATTGQPVPYASIGVLGTTRGTTSNAEGEFELREVALPGRLVVSELGHRRDTVAVTTAGASQPLQVRLQPASVQLPEVQVGSYLGELMTKAYRWLRRTNSQKTYAEAFYRQVSRLDGQVTEVQEMVWHAQTSSAGVEGTALAQARYARNNALINFKDFSFFTRDAGIFSPQRDSTTTTAVISPQTARFYTLKVLGATAGDDGQEFIEIGFASKPAVNPHHYQGSILLNSSTGQVLRLRLQTPDFHSNSNNPTFRFREEIRTFELVFKPLSNGSTRPDYFKIGYQGIMGRALRADVQLEASSVTYFYNPQPQPLAGIMYAPAQAGQPDIAAIKNTRYDPAFWRDNPVVKRTPLEEEIMKSFEQKGAFGTMLAP